MFVGGIQLQHGHIFLLLLIVGVWFSNHFVWIAFFFFFSFPALRVSKQKITTDNFWIYRNDEPFLSGE